MENPIKMYDLGVTPFTETPMYFQFEKKNFEFHSC